MNMFKARKRVLLVDRHPVFRNGLVHWLESQSDLGPCGEADSAVSALDVMRAARPDICVTDLILKGSSGFDLVSKIKTTYRHVPVLVVASHEESLYSEEALR